MPDTFTAEEERELARLLRKVQANKYWLPNLETYQEMQKTVSRWCFELVIVAAPPLIRYQWRDEQPQILMSRYTGDGIPQHHNKFHIPGGFEKFPEDETETINRIALDELGVEVEYLGLLGHHKWTADEHPWGGRIMSLYAACQPKGTIILSELRRFFTREEMLALGPDDMDPKHPHRKFIDEYLSAIEVERDENPVKYGF